MGGREEAPRGEAELPGGDRGTGGSRIGNGGDKERAIAAGGAIQENRVRKRDYGLAAKL